MLVRFSSNLLKWTFNRNRFVLIAFGSSFTVISLTLLYLVKFDMGMRGFYLGQVTGFAVFALLGLWFCRNYLTVPSGFAHGREMLSYGGPYMVTAVATCLIPALDRVMITNFLGLESTGLYAIGYRYAFMLMLPIQAIMAAWVPFTLAIYKESNAEETYNRGLILMTAGLAALSVVMVSVVEPIIELVASARYLPGHIVALPLMLGLIIQNISHIAGVGISLSKQTRYTMYSYIVGVVATAHFIWLLVQPFGIVGVANGALLGNRPVCFLRRLRVRGLPHAVRYDATHRDGGVDRSSRPRAAVGFPRWLDAAHRLSRDGGRGLRHPGLVRDVRHERA